MAVVEYEKEGRIAIIKINRPVAMNALNPQVHQELGEAMTSFRDDPELWVGIITGVGTKAFCAGGDISQFNKGGATEMLEAGAKRIRADQIWKPFIAAINGYALGGGLELAMECDLRIASENARLGQPEVNIGFMSGYGGTQRLPRFIPQAMAAELLLMGQRIDAQEAYRIGLVNKVVPLAQLMPTAKQWAEIICQAGPLGIRATKEAIMRGYNMTLEEGLRLERELAERVGKTEDFFEGTPAFLERRKPVYKAK